MSEVYIYKPPLGLDIRIKPPTEEAPAEDRPCGWPGCGGKGRHRAPLRPGAREHQWLCLEHVRAFNKTWNFFAGMSDHEVHDYIKDSLTGHRPTWTKSSGPTSKDRAAGSTRAQTSGFWHPDHIQNPFELFSDAGLASAARTRFAHKTLTKSQKQALEILDLDESVSFSDIKTKYKGLLKRYHPDANGGDHGTVERLRRVIKAYQVLKKADFGEK